MEDTKRGRWFTSKPSEIKYGLSMFTNRLEDRISQIRQTEEYNRLYTEKFEGIQFIDNGLNGLLEDIKYAYDNVTPYNRFLFVELPYQVCEWMNNQDLPDKYLSNKDFYKLSSMVYQLHEYAIKEYTYILALTSIISRTPKIDNVDSIISRYNELVGFCDYTTTIKEIRYEYKLERYKNVMNQFSEVFESLLNVIENYGVKSTQSMILTLRLGMVASYIPESIKEIHNLGVSDVEYLDVLNATRLFIADLMTATILEWEVYHV